LLSLLSHATGFAALRTLRQVLGSLRPARRTLVVADRELAQRTLGSFEAAALRTSDGLTLRGWFVPPKRRAAVALVHAGWGTRMQLLDDAQILAEAGYGVLLFDLRACGESEGDKVTWGDGERRDIVAALDYLSARSDIDPTRIGLLGFSIGGSAVALVAARDARARAVLLHATWTSLEDEVRWKWGTFGRLSAAPALWALRHGGVDVDAVRPLDVIADIAPRPLLLITGSEDDDTPVPAMERLFATARAPKELWVVPGAMHGGYVAIARDEYARRVVQFFDGALSG
jgi:dipeptidyl aminopeptidase/acylaminoacyl peptidase